MLLTKKDKYEHNNNDCHVPRAMWSREGCEDGHVVAADEEGGREAARHEVQGGHVEGGVRTAQVLLGQRHLRVIRLQVFNFDINTFGKPPLYYDFNIECNNQRRSKQL